MLNKIALYFGLQYKPSLVAEWKKYVKKYGTMIGRLGVNRCRMWISLACFMSSVYISLACVMSSVYTKWM